MVVKNALRSLENLEKLENFKHGRLVVFFVFIFAILVNFINVFGGHLDSLMNISKFQASILLFRKKHLKKCPVGFQWKELFTI